MATTSFQKKARIKVGNIPGTRPSLYNNQLLVSTGIPSLDNVVGGGLAVGTVMLVEEDAFGSYARLVLKYFTAEAVVSRQAVYLCSLEDNPEHLVKELPQPIDVVQRPEAAAAAAAAAATGGTAASRPPVGRSDKNTVKASDGGGGEDEKMKIAWRYQTQPKIQTTVLSGVQFGHYYDLTKVMDQVKVDAADIRYGPKEAGNEMLLNSQSALKNNRYCDLLNEIQQQIDEGFHTGQQSEKRNVLRIGIHSLGSPLWGENGGLRMHDNNFDPSLTQFFLALRAKLRSALAVAMVTVPTHLFQEKSFVHRLERMSDTVIRLESFAGSSKEKNPVFKEYHGLLHLIQLPRLNSLAPAQPETTDLAFKLRRKKFTIEKLHLPPELFDSTGRSQDDDDPLMAKVKTGSCGTTSDSKLAF